MNGENSSGIVREVERMVGRISDELERQRVRIGREANAVRAAAEAAGPLQPPGARRMAENLGVIIQAACSASGSRKPVTKQEIVKTAGMADSSEKSGPLYGYVIPAGLSEEQRRARRTVRKPEGYLRLVKAVASLTGMDEDALLLQLTEGTPLQASLKDLGEPPEPDHLEMLVASIRGQARRVTAACGLDWYFRTVDGHALVRTGQGWGSRHEDPDITDAIPIVWLATLERAAFDADWFPHLPDGTRGERQEKTALLCTRIGLCLAPFGSDGAVEPCFVRSYVTVVVGRRSAPRPGLVFQPFDPSIPVVLGVPMPGQQRIPGREGVLVLPDPAAVARLLRGLGEDYPKDEFDVVTPSSLARILDGNGKTVGMVPGDNLSWMRLGFTKAAPGTLLSKLEAALLDGCGEPSWGEEIIPLGTILEQRAAELSESLKRWVYAESAAIDERLSQMSADD